MYRFSCKTERERERERVPNCLRFQIGNVIKSVCECKLVAKILVFQVFLKKRNKREGSLMNLLMISLEEPSFKSRSPLESKKMPT